jgi:ATP-dependent DNA ligase
MSDYTWLRPEIETEIKFPEWTTGHVLRHAEFVSLQEMSESRCLDDSH